MKSSTLFFHKWVGRHIAYFLKLRGHLSMYYIVGFKRRTPVLHKSVARHATRSIFIPLLVWKDVYLPLVLVPKPTALLLLGIGVWIHALHFFCCWRKSPLNVLHFFLWKKYTTIALLLINKIHYAYPIIVWTDTTILNPLLCIFHDRLKRHYIYSIFCKQY